MAPEKIMQPLSTLDFLATLHGRHPSDATLGPTTIATSEANPPRVFADRSPPAHAPTLDEEKFAGLLRELGLFDEAWYRGVYPEANVATNVLAYFFEVGVWEGHRPNPYFDPKMYLDANPDVRDAGFEPLHHYVLLGEAEGRRPSPVFDPVWYRNRYGLQAGQSALGHYLLHRREGKFSPIPEFDAVYYTTEYRDIAQAQVDPFEHYINQGFKEGRNPSAEFDTRFYQTRYLNGDTNNCPLFHYISHKSDPNVFGRMPETETSVPREIRKFCQKGPHFEEFQPSAAQARPRAKILAYYLPQFHAFDENDRWWGQGFTEWTNVPRGVPRFAGHYQPRIPRDLGFYTLNHVETFRKQIKLAKGGGVYGFVFYYYWFNGKRLMKNPMDLFLGDESLDIPFCLMWANENWTRRWDGAESEVLIAQDYEGQSDTQLVDDFAQHFLDKRYIRIGGRPLLMLYRPGLIPNAGEAVARWRGLFQQRWKEDPIMVLAQGFNDFDPTKFGLDGAIEFPPHKLTAILPPANNDFEILDPDFSGQIYHYEDIVRASLGEEAPPFPLIKTAVPSWDNDARRQGSGLVITGSDPLKYEDWMSQLVARANKMPFFGEPFVCINAWNEWCEGAYLEPDLHFGGAYLNATRRAVSGVRRQSGVKLLLVGHDAFPSGAQHLLLNIGRQLRARHGVHIQFLLLGGGALESDYQTAAPTIVAGGDREAQQQLGRLYDSGFRAAIVNTTVAGRIVPQLSMLGIDSVLLVHELPRIIGDKNIPAAISIGDASKVVYAAAAVRDRVLELIGREVDERTYIVPNGLYKSIHYSARAADEIKQELGVPPDARLVIGVGYGDLRKGFDLFLSLWRAVRGAVTPPGGRSRKRRPVHFCWVGDIDPHTRHWFAAEIEHGIASGTFHLTGYRSDVEKFFSAADALALTSREDPYPAVVQEALAAGAAVVAFDQSGGIPDMLRETGFGDVVPYADTAAMAAAVRSALAASPDASERAKRGTAAREAFRFDRYVETLLRLAIPTLQRVSVILPNYNYARFMAERLGSIFSQAYPVHEIIVLDDCSSDDSVEVIRSLAREAGRDIILVANEKNSGSVFAQWRKGAELATGDYVWIAEADDQSDPEFLPRLMALAAEWGQPDLLFSDSRSITSDGEPLWPSYKDYFNTVEPGALAETGLFTGADFVRRFLSVKNLILNVSSVVWRRESLTGALDACAAELPDYKMAGDWRLYVEALQAVGARIGYHSVPLNIHRRHKDSVTHSLKGRAHVNEIKRVHRHVRDAFKRSKAIRETQTKYIREVEAQLNAKSAKTRSNQTLPPTRPTRTFKVAKATGQ